MIGNKTRLERIKDRINDRSGRGNFSTNRFKYPRKNSAKVEPSMGIGDVRPAVRCLDVDHKLDRE